VCRIFINGSVGSSMTYVNGADSEEQANVAMVESPTFGPSLLMLETVKPIQIGEELLLFYGADFMLPNYGASPAAPPVKGSKIKNSYRISAPPLTQATLQDPRQESKKRKKRGGTSGAGARKRR
jgi:hypothetical protein